MAKELPVRRRGGVGPAPVDHACGAHRQRRDPRQEHRCVVDGVCLWDRHQELRLRHLREVRLHLNTATNHKLINTGTSDAQQTRKTSLKHITSINLPASLTLIIQIRSP